MIEGKGTNGRLTFDGAVVTIHRGGMRAWVRGTAVRSIPARVITAVDLQPAGFGRGWIRFEVDSGDGDDEVDDAYDDDPDDLDESYEDDDGSAAGLSGWIGRSRMSRRAERAERFDPAGDPNTVMFTRGHQRAFEDIRREVKTAMWEASLAGPDDDADDLTPTRPLPPDDPVRELRQLGQLLRDGVLSRAEFDRAKARLLDRI